MLWVGAISIIVTTIVATIVAAIVVAVVVAVVVAIAVWRGRITRAARARAIGSVSSTLLRVKTGTGGSRVIGIVRSILT
jgi:hypothetical protein